MNGFIEVLAVVFAIGLILKFIKFIFVPKKHPKKKWLLFAFMGWLVWFLTREHKQKRRKRSYW